MYSKTEKVVMDFLVSSCEQHPTLRDGTVLRSSAVTISTTPPPKLVMNFLVPIVTQSHTGLHEIPGSVIPEGMSTMSNKYSMITFTINKTVTENWSTKVQKQRNSAATFIHFITEFTTS